MLGLWWGEHHRYGMQHIVSCVYIYIVLYIYIHNIYIYNIYVISIGIYRNNGDSCMQLQSLRVFVMDVHLRNRFCGEQCRLTSCMVHAHLGKKRLRQWGWDCRSLDMGILYKSLEFYWDKGWIRVVPLWRWSLKINHSCAQRAVRRMHFREMVTEPPFLVDFFSFVSGDWLQCLWQQHAG